MYRVKVWIVLNLISGIQVALGTKIKILSCSATPRFCSPGNTCRFRCPERCVKKTLSDLRRLELDYRICSHPDINTEDVYSLHAYDSQPAYFLGSSLSRRKRTLELTPQWRVQPTSQKVESGRKIELHCEMSHMSSSVKYQWYFNTAFPSVSGSTLAESDLYSGSTGTEPTLQIPSATSDNAGYYQCKVTDNTPSGHHIAWSDIIQIEIDNYYIKENSKVEEAKYNKFSGYNVLVFHCPDVDSNPPALIEWYKDNLALNEKWAFVLPFDVEETKFGTGGSSFEGKKNDLVIFDVTSAKNGVYSCRATNTVVNQSYLIKKFIVSTMAAATRSPLTPVVLRENKLKATLGGTVTLHCLTLGIPSDITIQWGTGKTVNQNKLTFNTRIYTQNHGREVVIKSVKLSDAQDYWCEASNSKGKANGYYGVEVKEATTETVPEVVITKAPAALYVHDNYDANPQPIFIPCTATGAEHMKFLRNGDILPESANYKYEKNVGITFEKFDSSDSGVYQCVGSNDNYWVQKLTFVMITAEVTAKATADVSLKDTNAVLSCAVGGYPYPDVEWFKDGNLISDTNTDSPIYVTNNPPQHLLTIKNIGFTDGGMYVCRATSKTANYKDPEFTHTKTSNVTLSIVAPLEISVEQNKITETVAASHTLQCAAYGKPLPDDIFWYFNNTKVVGSSKYSLETKQGNSSAAFSTLTITPLTTDDAGVYECRGSNTINNTVYPASAEIQLIVKYLKVTITEPVRAINNGDSVTVTCKAEGTPLPTEIKWFYGSTSGNAVESGKNGTTYTSSSESNHYQSVLTIASQQNDQNYVCEGVNTISDTAIFETAKLIIKTYKPVQASRNASFVEINMGEAATLYCACRGVPLPTEIKWTHKEIRINSNANSVIKETRSYDPEFVLSSTLAFSNPQSGDVGTYTCHCENTYLNKTYSAKTTVDLKVVTPVKIQWSTSNPKTAEFGQELNLTCSATGLPLPKTVVWSRKLSNSVEYEFLSNNQRFLKTEKSIGLETIQSILTFKYTVYDDDGVYKCFAENKIDTVHSAFIEKSLYIYQNPTITMAPTEVAAESGGSATLSCAVSSKPKPNQSKWQFKGSDVANQPITITDGYHRNSSYEVSIVTSATEGKYTCMGYSTYEGDQKEGEGHAYVRLYREISSSISTSPTSNTLVNENSEMNITCSALGVPQPAPFTWKLDSPLRDNDKISSDVGEIVNTVDYSRSDINIEVKSVMVIRKASYANLGLYSCSTQQVWKGKTTPKSHNFNMTVRFAAQLSSGSGTTELMQDPNTRINIVAVAIGNPSPDEIKWQWSDGTAITSDTTYTISNQVINDYKKTSSLIMVFQAQHHNRFIEAVTRNTLSITAIKLKFILKTKSEALMIIQDGSESQGATLTLTCFTTYNIGTVTWYKGNDKITESSRYMFSSNGTILTKHSILTIKELDSSLDSGNYTCEYKTGSIVEKDTYILNVGAAVVNTGLSTGVLIALIFLGILILIIIILIIIVFVYGRRKREKNLYADKPPPDGFQNKGYEDGNLQAVIVPDFSEYNDTPKLMEPIGLTSNLDDHDMKVATIARQATLTQQRPRKY